MARRFTINFSAEFQDVYEKVITEKNTSKVICEALREYYEGKKEEEDITEDMIVRMDIMIDRIEAIEKILEKR